MNQEKLTQIQLGKTYTGSPKGPFDSQRDRISQVSRKEDDYQNFKVGIYDIDEAVSYYFRKVILPTVMADGHTFDVPVVYATPEKWKAVQKDGIFRDKNGKRQIPVIIYKRESIEKVRNIANKLDANRPHNFYVTSVHYSPRNPYTNFHKTLNRIPEFDAVYTVVPDFVKVNYTCVVYTDYVEQMNSLVEAITFSSDSYWGDPNRFKFQSFIDSIKTEVEDNQGEDRVVKSTFELKLNGYILPRTVNTLPRVMGKDRNFTSYKITFSEKSL